MSQKSLCHRDPGSDFSSKSLWLFGKLLNFSEPHCYCCSITAQFCSTLCDPMDCRTPGLPVLHHLPELAQTLVHWVRDGIQPSHPLWSPSPPTFNFSQHQGLFQWVGLCIRWPKYCSFSTSPSNESSGLISFRIDWFDLPAVQGTPKSLLQHHSSKATVLQELSYQIFLCLSASFSKNRNTILKEEYTVRLLWTEPVHTLTLYIHWRGRLQINRLLQPWALHNPTQ